MQDNLLLDELIPTIVGRAYCPFWFDIKDEYLKHINKKYVFNEKGYCFDGFYKDTKLKKLNNKPPEIPKLKIIESRNKG